jgi:hypothetical protein
LRPLEEQKVTRGFPFGHQLQNPWAVKVGVRRMVGRALRGRVALSVKGNLGPAKRRGRDQSALR